MEYKSRHIQPFTLEQAVMLEVPVIAAEIARLQNSLTHLRDTQRQLQEIIDSEDQPDPDILQALKENDQVISSQEERISILRLALEHKGLVNHSNPHYDLPHSADPPRREAEGTREHPDSDSASEAEGVFL